MARARNIKPGFFKNDLLGEIDPLGRILFAGLWTIADRSGRLEDREKRIKAEVLPYDNVDVAYLLNELSDRGFLLRYEVEGSKYIQIVNWDKHQNPHKNEAISEIPEYSHAKTVIALNNFEKAPKKDGAEQEEHTASTVQVQDEHQTKIMSELEEHHTSTVLEHEKHHTSTVQTQEEHTTNPADSFNLIPDSLSLLKTLSASDEPNPITSELKKAIDCQAAIDKYHEICPTLPKVQILSDKRKKGLKALISIHGMDGFEKALRLIQESDFLTGRAPTGRPWTCNIDWILDQKNFIKIIEGNYRNLSQNPTSTGGTVVQLKPNKFNNFPQSMCDMSEEDLEAVVRRKEANFKAKQALKMAEG
jgi:hypothetical protein